MNYWADSHAHIYLEEFDGDIASVMTRAEENQVTRIYLPNIDHTSIDRMFELETKNSNSCIAMMGLHPCSVKKDFERELYIVEEWLAKRKFAAIGEMGTDLYWDKTFWDQQKEAFKIQVGWAQKYGLPIVIHCRESIDETIDMLEAIHDGKLRGVFHCFTGSTEQAERISKLGFYFGLGGVSTFKNSGMDQVIPQLDLNKILLETDSPYLSPVPHRGKRNEPSYIPLIADKVASLMQIDISELQKATSTNTTKLFGV